MRWVLFVGAVLLAAGSAGCGPNEIPGVAFCDSSVVPCAGSRRGARCALCDDADSSLGCQFPGTGQLAVCVATCESCAGIEPDEPAAPLNDPGQLNILYNVAVCWPARYREGSYCGRCGSADMTLATSLCDKDGFCNPVVCVADCATCPLVPSS